MNTDTVIYFALCGLLGAALYILVWSKTWRDLLSYTAFRHLVVGALSGVFYWMLHSEYNFPNSVMATVVGYFGPDLLQGIMEKLKLLIEIKEKPEEKEEHEEKAENTTVSGLTLW